MKNNIGRYIDTDDLKDLMYVACMGQDKQFIKMFETVIDDCPDAHISIKNNL